MPPSSTSALPDNKEVFHLALSFPDIHRRQQKIRNYHIKITHIGTADFSSPDFPAKNIRITVTAYTKLIQYVLLSSQIV